MRVAEVLGEIGQHRRRPPAGRPASSPGSRDRSACRLVSVCACVPVLVPSCGAPPRAAPPACAQAAMKPSISAAVARASPRLTRMAAAGERRRNAHGAQHVARLDLAGRAGRAGADRHAGEVERHHLRLARRRPARRCRLVLGSRGAAAPKMTRVRRQRAATALPGRRAARRLRPPLASTCGTARAAAPKPAMPATFSVPARRPRSWPPPRQQRRQSYRLAARPARRRPAARPACAPRA